MWLKRLLIIWIDKEMKYYILLLGLCLLGCNSQPSKQDKSIQPVIQKDDKFTNHYELPLTELEERLCNLLLEYPELTQSEIRERLDLSRSKVQRMMRKLTEDGIIIREGSRRKGYWTIHL